MVLVALATMIEGRLEGGLEVFRQRDCRQRDCRQMEAGAMEAGAMEAEVMEVMETTTGTAVMMEVTVMMPRTWTSLSSTF